MIFYELPTNSSRKTASKVAQKGRLGGFFCPYRSFAGQWAHLSYGREQASSDHVEICQGKLGGQRLAVLEQAPITNLAEVELPFDDPEGKFTNGPQAGQTTVDHLLPFRQLSSRRFFERHAPDWPFFGLTAQQVVFLAGVGLVAMHRFFFAVQQLIHDLVVRHFRRGEDQAVHHAAVGVRANMGFHAEVPLVAFFGGTHLRIALAFFVLGGGRRRDQGGIHHGALLEQQTPVAQFGVDLGQKTFRQPVLFKQVPEFTDRGLIRNGVHRQIKADETAVQRHFVQGLFHRRVGVVEEVLEQMDAQHGLQRNAAAAPASLGIVRLNGRKEPLPGNNGVHLLQKLFLAGLFAALEQARVGQAKLLHWISLRLRQVDTGIFA